MDVHQVSLETSSSYSYSSEGEETHGADEETHGAGKKHEAEEKHGAADDKESSKKSETRKTVDMAETCEAQAPAQTHAEEKPEAVQGEEFDEKSKIEKGAADVAVCMAQSTELRPGSCAERMLSLLTKQEEGRQRAMQNQHDAHVMTAKVLTQMMDAVTTAQNMQALKQESEEAWSILERDRQAEKQKRRRQKKRALTNIPSGSGGGTGGSGTVASGSGGAAPGSGTVGAAPASGTGGAAPAGGGPLRVKSDGSRGCGAGPVAQAVIARAAADSAYDRHSRNSAPDRDRERDRRGSYRGEDRSDRRGSYRGEDRSSILRESYRRESRSRNRRDSERSRGWTQQHGRWAQEDAEARQALEKERRRKQEFPKVGETVGRSRRG